VPTLRVVLDTNVLVSGLAYPGSIPGQIVAAWRQGVLEVVLSRYILDELGRVLPRLNHRLRWADADFADLLDILTISVDLVEPLPVPLGAARDSADLPVLGTLLAAGADYLITGDQDLLALADRHPILAPADFWRRHGG
jgi:putative PIN family toxin of toxin-antitoxin system